MRYIVTDFGERFRPKSGDSGGGAGDARSGAANSYG